jgi:hypothetical protein
LIAATLDLPAWIQSGLVFRLVAILLVLFALPLALPWRETLSMPVSVVSDSPPRSAIAPVDGVLATILVRDGAPVAPGARLAQLGDLRTIALVDQLELYATQTEAASAQGGLPPLPPSIVVGSDLQVAFDQLASTAMEFRAQTQFGGDNERIEQLQTLLASLGRQEREAIRRRELTGPLIEVSAQRLSMRSRLAANGWGSGDSVAASKQALIENQIAAVRVREEIEQLRAQAGQAQSNLAQARLSQQLKSSQLTARTHQAAIHLLGVIKAWRERNTIIAPVGGYVKFPATQNVGQTLPAGAEFAVIVPADAAFVAIGTVAPNSRADVLVGDEVRLAMPNYPPARYGYVRGKVINVSGVASGGNYAVRIGLPDGIKTSNGFVLPVRQRASATGLVSVRQGSIGQVILGGLGSRLGFN